MNDIQSRDILKLMSQVGLYALVHFDFRVCLHVKCHKLMHKCITANPLVLYKHCHSIDMEKWPLFSFFFSHIPTLTTLCSISSVQIADTIGSVWDLSAYGCIHSRFMRNLGGISGFLSWACKICSPLSWREALLALLQSTTVIPKERN